MKKILWIAAAALLTAGIVSCGGKKTETAVSENVESVVLTVDDVLASADSLIGQTIEVEGVCSHLCQHGGKKAFLLNSDSSAMLRAEVAEGLDSFPKESVRKMLRITGIVVEDRIDEAAVKQMEKDYGTTAEVHGESEEEGCDAEKTAQGQAEINSFAARMQDFRDKIAARQAKEGKAYLSFYHIDAQSYEIVNDSIKQ